MFSFLKLSSFFAYNRTDRSLQYLCIYCSNVLCPNQRNTTHYTIKVTLYFPKELHIKYIIHTHMQLYQVKNYNSKLKLTERSLYHFSIDNTSDIVICYKQEVAIIFPQKYLILNITIKMLP